MSAVIAENSPVTVLAQLVAKEDCGLGYETYVFKCLDKDVEVLTRYIMCIRYPNWNHRELELDEIGYLNFLEVRAGIDKWFDGTEMIPYRYNAIQFLKFVEKPREKSHEYVM